MHRFKASRVKEIIGSVLVARLSGQQYHADNTSSWAREIADEIKNKLKGRRQEARAQCFEALGKGGWLGIRVPVSWHEEVAGEGTTMVVRAGAPVRVWETRQGRVLCSCAGDANKGRSSVVYASAWGWRKEVASLRCAQHAVCGALLSHAVSPPALLQRRTGAATSMWCRSSSRSSVARASGGLA